MGNFGGDMGDLMGGMMGGNKRGGGGRMGGGMEDLLSGMMRGFPGKSHSRGDGGSGGVAGAEGTPDLYGKSSPVHRIGKVPTAASTNNWLIHFYSPESSRSQRLVGVM